MTKEKVVLAYSGGLDTSVAISWIREQYNLDVVTLTVDLGQEKDIESIRNRALATGAVKALVFDEKELFVDTFVWPALQAGAIYEGQYPLATALGRPLIAWLLCRTAQEEGAIAVAHGCTGKGNDQVRIDTAVHTINPGLRIIAPVREWKMSRDEEMRYAQSRDIPISTSKAQPYSIDQNLWGRSIEAGILEDPSVEPPADVFQWTANIENTPDVPQYIEVSFDKGIPTALDGEKLGGVDLIQKIGKIAGSCGIGRIDHVENRLIGIKSREIYEAPAALVLHIAHRALEDMTLSKDQNRFKNLVSQYYADLIYNGLWFSAFHQDLRAFIASNQRNVSGIVRVKLFKGSCTVVGRNSPMSLYRHELATYDSTDQFDHEAAEGFIKLFSLPQRIQFQTQMLKGEGMPGLLPPA